MTDVGDVCMGNDCVSLGCSDGRSIRSRLDKLRSLTHSLNSLVSGLSDAILHDMRALAILSNDQPTFMLLLLHILIDR